jgi:hypothetical protein
MSSVRLVLISLLSSLLLSCNSDPGNVGKTVPVAGKITLGAQPLHTGTIAFVPNKQKGNPTPHVPGSEIDAEGNYKLITATKVGAPPGWYKVVIVSTEPPNSKDPFASRKSFIDARYNTAERTPLEVEVVEGAPPGAYDFPVSPPAR